MVDTKKGTNGESPLKDLSDENLSEHCSGEHGTASTTHQPSADLAMYPDNSSVALVPALRVILASVERMIGPPVGMNKELAGTLRRLHAVLGRLPRVRDAEFINAMEALANGHERARKGNHIQPNTQPIRDLPLDEIERMISDPNTSKQDLLAIVRERFGGSTGSLAKLKHEALRERVAALAMNERGHETVARLASGDSKQLPSEKISASTVAKTEPNGNQPPITK